MKHMFKAMLKTLGLAAFALSLAAPAQAQCYADYKAKRDNPLKLHYGVIELPDRSCGSRNAAQAAIAARLAPAGWTLLQLVSIFDASGLNDAKRVESAGAYFLRF